VKTIAKASAVLLVLTGCARAQQHASASIVKELTSAWVRYYAETYHVPTELVEAIIDQESAWNPCSVVEGCSWPYAIDAKHSRAIWDTKSLPRRPEHQRRSGIPRMAKRAIQR